MNVRARFAVIAAAFLPTCGILDPGPRAGDLTFEVREVDYWSPGSARQIVLFVEGDRDYPCMNYRIESNLVVQGNLIRDEMSGAIKAPVICLTAIGPAVFAAALGIAEGTYILEFVRGGLTDRYRLTVTQTAIAIATLEAHFTRPSARITPRAA